MNASDILETTAATEPILDIASIKEAMDGFHPESLLPDLTKLFGHLPGLCRLAVMIGPIVARNSESTAITSSGSAWSVNEVKPRRSENTQTTSRR